MFRKKFCRGLDVDVRHQSSRSKNNSFPTNHLAHLWQTHPFLLGIEKINFFAHFR
jgi:hypothetical protein